MMPQFSIGVWLAPFVDWLNANLHSVFDFIGGAIEVTVGALQSALLFPPAFAVIAATTLLVAGVVGLRTAVLAFLCLGFCWITDLWAQSIQTIALVFLAVTIAVLIAVPMGIWAARSRRLEAALRPLLDIMQTVPPWVYLIPAVILFSLGQVPAVLATIIYAIPPMLRLTTLAFRQVPTNMMELGQAIGASRGTILRKIEFPAALPTLIVGLNQCILMALAMVVLAGLVGAGGLGAEVTRGLTRMEMGLGLRAGLAIVAIALLFDRVSRSALQRGPHKA